MTPPAMSDSRLLLASPVDNPWMCSGVSFRAPPVRDSTVNTLYCIVLYCIVSYCVVLWCRKLSCKGTLCSIVYVIGG